MFIFETNFFAVALAAALSMVAGYFWYHDNAFGRVWKEAHGIEEKCKESVWQLAGGFVNMVVVAWVFGALLSFFGVTSLVGAVTVGFWCWLGFIATTQFSGVIWCKKPLSCYFVDVGFFLVMMVIMAIVHVLF